MNRVVILAVVLFLALPAAHAVVNTTGTITLDNVNGQLTAGLQPSTGISVTFESAAASSGGGGGGGGGADVTGPLDPSTTHLYDAMEPDKEYTFRSPGEPYFIRAITFQVLANKTQVLFRLTHILNITRETVPPLGPGYEVLGYERFDYTGLFKDEVAQGVRIRWGMPLSMLAARGFSAADMGLYRYDGANWALLKSTSLETNETDLALYEARSPGLSYFAIAYELPPSIPSPGASSGNVVTGEATGGTTPPDASGATGTGGSATTGEEGGEPMAAAKKGTSLPLLSILVVLIIGGAIIGYYYYDSRQKVAAVNAQALKPRPDEPLMGFASIEEDAFQDPVERLRAYVDKELRQGFRREAIASQLRKSGWPENIITNVLDNFGKEYLQRQGMHEPHEDYGRVLAFLKEKLDLGYDVNVIRRSLVKTGWDANLIDSLLGELHQEVAEQVGAYTAEALDRLRVFIADELKKGYSRAQIRGVLLKAGWQEKVLDEELAKK